MAESPTPTMEDLAPEVEDEVDEEVKTETDVDSLPSESLGELAVVTEQLPTLPQYSEWLQLCQMSAVLASSELVPKPLRGKPADVLLVLLTGRDLQIGLTTALRSCHVIEGQVTVAPKLRAALVEQKGLGRLLPKVDREGRRAVAFAFGPNGERLGDTEYSWEDATLAGLVGVDCESPLAHAQACTTWFYKRPSERGAKPFSACKTNWRMYPWRMLTWRAMGYAGDDYFPSAALGLYSPDELGAVTDQHGEVIDVYTVELPPGFEPEPVEMASPDLVAEVERFVDALAPLKQCGEEGEKLRDQILGRWKAIAETPSGKAVAPEDLSAEQANRILRLASAVSGQVTRTVEKHDGREPSTPEAVPAEQVEVVGGEEPDDVDPEPEVCPTCGSTNLDYAGDLDETGECAHYECADCNNGFDWPPGCGSQTGAVEPDVEAGDQRAFWAAGAAVDEDPSDGGYG